MDTPLFLEKGSFYNSPRVLPLLNPFSWSLVLVVPLLLHKLMVTGSTF